MRFGGQPDPHFRDCTVSAFAMCVGIREAEALVTIAAIAPQVLRKGASWGQLKRAAATRKMTLVEKRTAFDSTTWAGGGILGVRYGDGEEHAVYFKRGLIFDGQARAVWDADTYLRVNKVTVLTMLVRTP